MQTSRRSILFLVLILLTVSMVAAQPVHFDPHKTNGRFILNSEGNKIASDAKSPSNGATDDVSASEVVSIDGGGMGIAAAACPLGGASAGGCTDTDGCIVYDKKGTVKDNWGEATDECLPKIGKGGEIIGKSDGIREWYCSKEAGANWFTNIERKCTDGCKEGACVSSKIELPSCTDSDGGITPDITGDVTSEYGEGRMDYCNDEYSMTELTCGAATDANWYKETKVACPNGCANGACLAQKPASKCTEFDKGRDYYTAGAVQKLGAFDYTDWCSSFSFQDDKWQAAYVNEYYCDGEQVAQSVFQCPFGCSDGACRLRQNYFDTWDDSNLGVSALIAPAGSTASFEVVAVEPDATAALLADGYTLALYLNPVLAWWDAQIFAGSWYGGAEESIVFDGTTYQVKFKTPANPGRYNWQLRLDCDYLAIGAAKACAIARALNKTKNESRTIGEGDLLVTRAAKRDPVINFNGRPELRDSSKDVLGKDPSLWFNGFYSVLASVDTDLTSLHYQIIATPVLGIVGAAEGITGDDVFDEGMNSAAVAPILPPPMIPMESVLAEGDVKTSDIGSQLRRAEIATGSLSAKPGVPPLLNVPPGLLLAAGDYKFSLVVNAPKSLDPKETKASIVFSYPHVGDKCVEGDKGNDPETASTLDFVVSGKKYPATKDTCLSPNTQVEAWCEPKSLKGYDTAKNDCSGGCLDGACKQSVALEVKDFQLLSGGPNGKLIPTGPSGTVRLQSTKTYTVRFKVGGNPNEGVTWKLQMLGNSGSAIANLANKPAAAGDTIEFSFVPGKTRSVWSMRSMRILLESNSGNADYTFGARAVTSGGMATATETEAGEETPWSLIAVVAAVVLLAVYLLRKTGGKKAGSKKHRRR